jgi:hypothetical protein
MIMHLLPNIINGHHQVVKGTSEAINVVISEAINVVISEAINVVISEAINVVGSGKRSGKQ